MNLSEEKRKLLEEFPELAEPDICLQKEVYAHFGLAFMKFGLVEHSMINVITFFHVGDGFQKRTITNRQSWEAAFDAGHATAIDLTFGNLIKRVVAIQEFTELESELREVKRLRDYFAHRFMRDEAQFNESEEGCWLLLTKIGKVRHQVMALEDALRPRFEAMCQRLAVPLPSQTQIEEMIDGYFGEAAKGLASGSAKVGWE